MSGAVRTIEPLRRPPDCEIRVPGSKSLTNRALVIAALADGESVLDDVLFSDDTQYMIDAWRRVGIPVRIDAPALQCTVQGHGGAIPTRHAELYVGNAGTAMRFLVAALCLADGRFVVDGSPRMRQRPIQDLLDALTQLGARVRSADRAGCPPVVIDAHGLAGGQARMSAAKSGQFVSAVLMAAPYMRHGLALDVEGPIASPPYVRMTLELMNAFGVRSVSDDAAGHFAVTRGRYAARRYRIEPDASSAHYFLAAAALTGGRVRVPGLGNASLQGDVRFVDLLEQMGAVVEIGADYVEVRGGELDGIDADLNAISDTAPTLAVLAPFARRPVAIRNIAHARLQESDRLHAVATELARLGVCVRELADGLVIEPSRIRPGVVDTYDDHRIAMSFALIGLRVPGIGIRDPDCVRKTFPDFFTRLEELRQ
jgi:3-phosphoshikimate 1-carboxyvinyltransferase